MHAPEVEAPAATMGKNSIHLDDDIKGQNINMFLDPYFSLDPCHVNSSPCKKIKVMHAESGWLCQ
jgi:hypothetical protein